MNRELAMLEKLEKSLNLKQLQIRSLLTITQAINDNISQEGLFKMYNSFLSWEMGIERMALYVFTDNGWYNPTNISYQNKHHDLMIDLLQSIKRMHTVKKSDPELLQEFDVIIPVYHKDYPIAYSLIGGIKEKEDLYNKIQFITTITNIIAVAVENKRLFKRQIEQEKYKKELELAKEVQAMLIPNEMPVNERYALSTIYKPHFNVGGDYLDYIKFDDSRFAFCIADISGKGVAAALLMANFQAKIQSLIFQYRDLETFVFALNQSVYQITKSDKFITFFIAEVDVEKHTLRYVNAGHFPPILIEPSGKTKRLDKGCTVIGAFDKLPEISEEELDLLPGSMVISFTDGLAELKGKNNLYFEEKDLEAFINKHKNLDPQTFNNRLLKEIDTFRGEEDYKDDIAVLTCKIFK
jgi:sigma-B regulation protein RsbU (phosphoserine phosphatase)